MGCPYDAVGMQRALDSAIGLPSRSQRVRQNRPTEPAWKWIVVASGHAASFNVYGADYDALHDRPCPKTSAATITLPNETAKTTVRVRIPDCGRFLVAPLIAGSVDRDSRSVVVG